MGSADQTLNGGLSRRALLRGLGLSAIGLGLSRGARAEDDTPAFTLSNARIVVGDGTEIQGGVRVEARTIVEVGPGVTGGTDLQGATLWPGAWNGGSPLGLWEIDLEAGTHDESEGMDRLVPQVRALDSYNPRSELIPVTRLGGVVGNLLMPGGGRPISGQAAWVRLAGEDAEEAAVLAPAGLCLNVGSGGRGGGVTSRMGVMAALRDCFDANRPPAVSAKEERAQAREQAQAERRARRSTAEVPESSGATISDTGDSDFQRAIHALLRRKLKALISADRASDLLLALELIQQYDLDAVLIGAAEAHLVAEEIAAAGVPLLLGPVTAQPGGFDTLYATCHNAARLHAAGVRFGLRDGSAHNLRQAPILAGIAVAYGLPREAAVAALCSQGPALWELPVGKIQAGCEATFVQCDGDPLQPRTATTGLWFQGRPAPITSRQTALYERFRTLR